MRSIIFLSPLCNRGDVIFWDEVYAKNCRSNFGPQRQRGHLLFVFLLLNLLLSGCATPSQVYWDHKVKELCEKDGGVTVYEKVELTREEYDNLKDFQGAIKAPDKKYAKANDVLVSTSVRTILKSENPTVDRIETQIFRKSDMKLLGYEISYARIGGDFPTGISHPSTFSCGDIEEFVVNINKLIYSIKGE